MNIIRKNKLQSIVLIEDHSIVRLGLVTLIESAKKFTIEDTYSNGVSGLKGIKLKKPDFAIIDLNLPDMPGEMIIRDLFLSDSKTKIIVLSQQQYVPQISHLLSMNIGAYVLKDNAAGELLEAIEFVSRGERYLSPSIELLMGKMGHLTNKKGFHYLRSQLTERELEIAQLICQGNDTKTIAERVSIAPVTVRVHLKNILTKMELKNVNDIIKLKNMLF